MSEKNQATIYIANDVECSGGRLGVDSVLSIGACVVTPTSLWERDYIERGFTFYREVKPQSRSFNIDAMRVGCRGLDCLAPYRGDPGYDPESADFHPTLVLDVLERVGSPPAEVARDLVAWLKRVSEGRKIEGVVDTAFFDGGFLRVLVDKFCDSSPYGWKGTDLASMYKGFARDAHAKLEELGVPDNRATPHRALDDAIFLAQTASKLIYNLMSEAY